MNFSDIETALLNKGLVIIKNENLSNWGILEGALKKTFATTDLSKIHTTTDSSQINNLRLSAFQSINSLENWDRIYFSMAKSFLLSLLGPDLLIQRKLNLSVQMPFDSSSSLGFHTDTLSGQSPFELVMWTPFSRFSGNAGMYYFDRDISRSILIRMKDTEEKGLESLKTEFWDYHQFLEIKTDEIALFSGSIFHGNIVNTTNNTRVSINCRFKNLYSPEGSDELNERGVGIFYKLLCTSPVTEIGMSYSDNGVLF